MPNYLVATLSLSTFIAFTTPRITHACSCVSEIKWAGVMDGAEDVALDIAPLLSGGFDANSVRWQTTDGVAVPFTTRAGGAGPYACSGMQVELVPSQPLSPATSYVISAKTNPNAVDVQQIGFTTGNAKLPDAPLPEPTLTATLLRGNPVRDSCVSEVHGCLAVGPHPTELTFLGAGDQLLGWMMVSGETVIERGAHPDTVCIEARTRDGAGRRSAAVRRCGDELGFREARLSNYENYGLTCRAGRVLESPDGGAVPSSDSGPLAEGDASTAVASDAEAGIAHMTPSVDAATTADAANGAIDPSFDEAASGDGCSAASGATGPYRGIGALSALGLLAVRLRRRRA